jgi:hypothetical protein
MSIRIVTAMAMVLSLGWLVEPAAAQCAADSVESGTVCLDKYEASVWKVVPTQKVLINRIRDGKATLANLTSGGAVQLGIADGDLAANGCPVSGNGCVDVYAVSIAGVTPARWITWFQAAAAARNSLKRLPTNQEWQAAALGTPDTGGADNGTTTCNTDNPAPGSGGVTSTGSRSGCVSDVGAFDMVGNLAEWVADWADVATGCSHFGTEFGSDKGCVGPGFDTFHLPSAFVRGGHWLDSADAGVFTVDSSFTPTFQDLEVVGFRAVR